MMKQERGKLPPVPDNWREYLTNEQEINLGLLQNFGWTINFIRRPAFEEVVVVLEHPTQGYRLLDKDGDFKCTFNGLREGE